MSDRMTKSEFMKALAETWDVSKAEADSMYESMLEVVYGEVKRSGELMLPGLGKMFTKMRKARKGRNPATGETIQIPAKLTLKFKVNKPAKDAVLPE